MNETIKDVNQSYLGDKPIDLNMLGKHVRKLENLHGVTHGYFEKVISGLKLSFEKLKSEAECSSVCTITDEISQNDIQLPELIIKSSPSESENEFTDESNKGPCSQDSVIYPSPDASITPSKFQILSTYENKKDSSTKPELSIAETALTETSQTSENEPSAELISETPLEQNSEINTTDLKENFQNSEKSSTLDNSKNAPQAELISETLLKQNSEINTAAATDLNEKFQNSEKSSKESCETAEIALDESSSSKKNTLSSDIYTANTDLEENSQNSNRGIKKLSEITVSGKSCQSPNEINMARDTADCQIIEKDLEENFRKPNDINMLSSEISTTILTCYLHRYRLLASYLQRYLLQIVERPISETALEIKFQTPNVNSKLLSELIDTELKNSQTSNKSSKESSALDANALTSKISSEFQIAVALEFLTCETNHDKKSEGNIALAQIDESIEKQNLPSEDHLDQFMQALDLQRTDDEDIFKKRRIIPTKIVSPKDKLKHIDKRELDKPILNPEILNTIEASLFEDSPENIFEKQTSDGDVSESDSIKKMEEEILNENYNSDNVISDVDTSDEETKLMCRKALQNLLDERLSTELESSAEEEVEDEEFLDDFFNEGSGKIIKLNVEEELKKTPVKSQPDPSASKSIDFNKTCKVQLENLVLNPEYKRKVKETDLEEAEFKKLCSLSSLKRRRVITSSENDRSASNSPKVKSTPKRNKTKDTNKKKSSSSSDELSSSESFKSVSSTTSASSKSTQKSMLASEDNSESSLANSGSESISDLESNVKNDSSSSSSSSVPTKRQRMSKRMNSSNSNSDSEELGSNSSKSEGKRTPTKKADWENDPLLRYSLNTPRKKSVEKERKKSVEEIEVISEDSGSSSGEEFVLITGKDTKKPAPKLRQTKLTSKIFRSLKLSSDDSDAASSDEKSNEAAPDMKKIRKVKSFQELATATRKANQEEKERLLRLTQIHNSYDETASQQRNRTNVLVLEYNPVTKKPRVQVSKQISDVLKDYQRSGVRFMWDSCFESIELAATTRGSGCVVGHCMGLGKTLQVITLIHTLFKYQSEIKIKRVLILAPPSTIQNWQQEFKRWVGNVEPKFNVYTLLDHPTPQSRLHKLKMWFSRGGAMIMNYALFRALLQPKKKNLPKNEKYIEQFTKFLLKPGPELLVCDEGHTLKNSKSQISDIIGNIETKRRIMLTGTPMQNNLKEYYCMINLVKPGLLGSDVEFANQFINPITAGQTKDSSAGDITRMKKRSHVLHKKLSGVVQRVESSVLKTYLPSLIHYIIFIKLSDHQLNIYKSFLKVVIENQKGAKLLLQNYQIAKRITTHPKCLTYRNTQIKKKVTREVIEEEDGDEERPLSQAEELTATKVWESLYSKEELNDVHVGSKIVVFFNILNQCAACGDKVIAFSTSLNILNVIEDFCKESPIEGVTNYRWVNNLDYVRIDGSMPKQKRYEIYERFNDANSKRLKLLITSTKVSGLGVNLTGGNRIIILDTPWNPADDMQCVYRIYRLGQAKPCYIYSLVGLGTMEERIYERSVTKQAVACRVIDEQQIDRHYTSKGNVIKEFYTFRNYDELDTPAVNVPSDRILANALQQLPNIIWKYHEHDKLLQNQEDEELDDAEREAAWNEFLMEEKRQNEATAALAAMSANPSTIPYLNPGISTIPVALTANNTINQAVRTVLQNQILNGPVRPQSFQGVKNLRFLLPNPVAGPSTTSVNMRSTAPFNQSGSSSSRAQSGPSTQRETVINAAPPRKKFQPFQFTEDSSSEIVDLDVEDDLQYAQDLQATMKKVLNSDKSSKKRLTKYSNQIFHIED